MTKPATATQAGFRAVMGVLWTFHFPLGGLLVTVMFICFRYSPRVSPDATIWESLGFAVMFTLAAVGMCDLLLGGLVNRVHWQAVRDFEKERDGTAGSGSVASPTPAGNAAEGTSGTHIILTQQEKEQIEADLARMRELLNRHG